MNDPVPILKPDSVRSNRYIILLDGLCNLCSAFLVFVYRRDPAVRFRFCWVQSPAGIEILSWAGLPVDSFQTMLYVEDGIPYRKSAAFLGVARHLRFPWWVLAGGVIIPRPIRDWLYDRISRSRYRLFGKKSECLLPGGEIQSRFIV
ncbi:MAG: DCC1-like thiol-disulfide oxidoreductase family protein [Ignavibacteria bacterium]|nr:DCC1-like thiol-disulfide oxidoreductase family protein [Ignavibacteria bacterium]